MVEHEVCKGCIWNDYPVCLGTKMSDDIYMNIENLKSGFECGQKDSEIITDFSVVIKSELELLQEKFDVLEARILELENK